MVVKLHSNLPLYLAGARSATCYWELTLALIEAPSLQTRLGVVVGVTRRRCSILVTNGQISPIHLTAIMNKVLEKSKHDFRSLTAVSHRNGGPKWGSQIVFLNWGPMSGSQFPNRAQIRVPNQGPKLGSQIGVPNLISFLEK
jgi:hypothetical protein